MKKLIGLVMVLGSVFLLTGCLAKTEVLECKITEDSDQVKSEMVSNFTFKNDLISIVDFSIIMESANEETKESFDLMVPIMNGVYEDFEKIEGVTYESTFEEGIFTLNFNLNYDLITDDDLTELENLDLDITEENRAGTIEELKQALEAEGYTCEIK